MSLTPTALIPPIIEGVEVQECSVTQASLMMLRGERTIRRYIAQGLLPAVRLPNGQIRIRIADLNALGEPVNT